ncbi:MAG: glycosyltransferase family 4 protein [Polyangia bacterium]
MRVLLINQYYYPDIAATAQLCTDWAEDLARAGVEVTVLTGTGRYRVPHHGEHAAALPQLPPEERHHGVRIVRVPVPDAPPPGSASPSRRERAARLGQRGLGYARFGLGALRELVRLPRPELVVALSTPPLIATLGLVAQRLRGARLVYWVQDVYPELLTAMGLLAADARPVRLLAAMARRLYRAADRIIALDPAMAARLIAAGAEPSRVVVIDHFADCRELVPQPLAKNPLRARLGLGDAFVACYAGNHGRGHDFDTLIEALRLQAAERAAGETDAGRPLHWLFVGDGEQKARLLAAVPPALRDRVHSLPPQARSELRDVLTAGDVGLVTLRAEMAGLMAPSKLYGLLAAGCPVVYVGPEAGRIPQLLAEEPVGVALRNGDAAGLLRALRELAAQPERRQAMAQRARELAETRYDRTHITRRHLALLSELAREGGP